MVDAAESVVIPCADISFLPEVARQIIDLSTHIILLNGDLGAGKTTLVTEIARQLGVEDPVTSPTFALVNEYRLGNGNPMYHFDFYRINDVQEAVDIGFEEYLEADAMVLIEWPDKITPLIPEVHTEVKITSSTPAERTFEVTNYG